MVILYQIVPPLSSGFKQFVHFFQTNSCIFTNKKAAPCHCHARYGGAHAVSAALYFRHILSVISAINSLFVGLPLPVFMV